MLVGRNNEKKQTWFRSERVFNCNGEWYFHTREGIDVGPYLSQFDASVDAALLIQKLRQSSDEDALEVIHAHAKEVREGADTLRAAATHD